MTGGVPNLSGVGVGVMGVGVGVIGVGVGVIGVGVGVVGVGLAVASRTSFEFAWSSALLWVGSSRATVVPLPKITRLVSISPPLPLMASCVLMGRAMRLPLGSGSKPLIRSDVFMRRSRSTSTGSGRPLPLGFTINICPAWRR